MDYFFYAFAAVGLALLWHRAEPVAPVRNWLLTFFFRQKGWLDRNLEARFWKEETPGAACWHLVRVILRFLIGVLSCFCCSATWSGFFLGLVVGAGFRDSLLLGAVSFLLAMVFDRLDKGPSNGSGPSS